MDERMNRLLDLEKKILINRQELQRLMQESGASDKNLMNDKLNQLNQEIEFMRRQVQFLQYDLNRKNSTVVTSNNDVAANDVIESSKINESQLLNKEQQVMAERHKPSTIQTLKDADVLPQWVKEPKENNDFENKIGKSFMGIMASVLIFISLILFATVIVPYFGEIAKMVTTYVVSFTFVLVGFIKLRKDRTNKFYISISACGVGAVYISLLLSNIYFKKIEAIPLYILITIWGISVCFLGKLQNKIFQIIGEIGITISVVFGCCLCMENDDVAKFIAVIIFYIFTSTVFYIVHFDKEFIGNLAHHIFNEFNCFVILISYMDVFDGEIHIIGYFILLLLVFNLISMVFNKLEKSNVSYGIIGAMYLFRICGILELITVDYIIFGIIVYLMSVVLVGVFEYKKSEKRDGINILHVVLIILMAIGLDNCGDIFYYAVVPCIILPLLLLGFSRKNKIFKYCPMVFFIPFVMGNTDLNVFLEFIFVVLVIGTAFFCIHKCKEQYSKIFKYFMYVLSVFSIIVFANDILREFIDEYYIRSVIAFMFVAIYNVVMLKTRFSTNFATGEREKPAIFNIINTILMIVGLSEIGAYDGIWNALLIITVIGIFFVNAKNILDKRNNLFGGMYVGFKFTFLMIVLMESFDAISYVISIACFVFAILSIVIGFVAKYKSLRVYGLVLSLISTFKLVMFDISYDNTLGHSISFFVSGILCFVICLIYNLIDNKINKE